MTLSGGPRLCADQNEACAEDVAVVQWTTLRSRSDDQAGGETLNMG